MIPASQVVELFDADQVAPGVGGNLRVGGYENNMNSDKIVYYPGGYGTVGSMASSVSDAGPSGILLAGGGRKSRKVRKSRTQKKNKKQRKSRRVRFSRRSNKKVRFSRRSNKKVRFSRRNQLFRFRQ